MHSFDVQPSELPQQYDREVEEPVSYSCSRYASRNYRFHPYLGPPPSKQASAILPFFKQGPPNAVVLPVAETNARLTQLPMMMHRVEDTRHAHALDGIRQAHSIDDVQHPNPTDCVSPLVDLRRAHPIEVVRKAQEDAVVYDYYVRKERRSSASLERNTQHQGVTTENGRQRGRQSQFISVIKMPTKADMKNIQPNSDKTKDVVLEEFASSLLKDWKETCNASTQTEDLVYPPPSTSPFEPMRQDQARRQTSVCTAECQTDQPPEENPQLTPLVTPPLYGIDPKTGNAISVVFHFRLPKQNANAAMLEATTTSTTTQQ